ncbi:MAG: hypothetical protein EA424_19790 [Planctomycetaceae bacterium]|nr:MAG: hypothetical protein EA424_19790 [Planctomycetaceae bacterium]
MMKTLTPILLVCLSVGLFSPISSLAADPIRVMIIGGQNNHNWALSTPYMKELLDWRNPKYGYSLYVDDQGQVVREAPGEGRGMGHGSQYDWMMTVRDAEHPVTEGMPTHWMHKHDELYHGQRGPAEDIHILLTAFSDPAPNRRGTGKHEPIVWWVPYGEGRVLTNLMGHVGQLGCMQCVGFQVLLYRGCEWLATGQCQTPIPDNFPTAEATSLNP